MRKYQPPLTLTPRMLALAVETGERAGHLFALHEGALMPQLRRGNRIHTTQASLAIENSALSVEQVTAVLDGKRVLGLSREIQEACNTFSAYEVMPEWQPSLRDDLLAAHALLMHGLIDDTGSYRRGGVGIYRGERLLHMAPPANRVPQLMDDLLVWLSHCELHPLIVSCVFHYEFKFIRPFADGNGRMERLWQTLILSQWRAVLAYLSAGSVIRKQQDVYCEALAISDKAVEAAPFVEFMLAALHQALLEGVSGNQVSDQVSDQVARLLRALPPGKAFKANELIQRLRLAYCPTFSNNYLKPVLVVGSIEVTDSASPRSPAQKYRQTGFSE